MVGTKAIVFWRSRENGFMLKGVSVVAKKWVLSQVDTGISESLQKTTGLSPVIAQLLTSRGIVSPDHALQFIDAKLSTLRPPEQLPGAKLAADLLYDAVRQNKKIAIYGDYDCDGMTSTAILFRCLKIVGADVIYFVPNRLDDGYGLNCESIQSLADRGAQFLLSVDCGIASIQEIQFARDLGMTVVVSDHHTPGEKLPDADAIVHPGIDQYPFAGLCGAGVALKIAWAFCKRVSGGEKVEPRFREFLITALALAAIGTVADVVPLVDENRVIVRHGLNSLAKTSIQGLREILRITGLDKKPFLSAEDIGFVIGPRLNASGRLGQAQLGVELLTSSSNTRVEALADYIANLNSSRDSIERKITKAVKQQIKDQFDPENEPALVLAEKDWHQGVIGIVAGRIAEKFQRPTVVISMKEDGELAVGSARSALGIDIYRAFAESREHLISFGGHRAAAGIKITPQQIDNFREALCQAVLDQKNVTQLQPELKIDIEVALAQLTLAVLGDIEKLAPFGQANRRPVFCANAVELAAPPKRMGESGRHLSLTIVQHGIRLRAVAFGQGDWAEELEKLNAPFDIVFHPVINEFRGRRSVEMQLIDWRPCPSSVPEPKQTFQDSPQFAKSQAE